jgi:DNA-binding transcriptional regulator GbsR (MarR family)
VNQRHALIDRLAGVLISNGFPAMPARVFMAIVISDDGAMTAAELADTLEASPAAISGAAKYLRTVRFVTQTNVRGSRQHRYSLAESGWYASSFTRTDLYGAIARELDAGVDQLENSPGRERLAEVRDFFRFLERRLPGLLAEWQQELSTRGTAS